MVEELPAPQKSCAFQCSLDLIDDKCIAVLQTEHSACKKHMHFFLQFFRESYLFI